MTLTMGRYMSYDSPIIYDGNPITDKYVALLNKEEREKLIDPLTDIFFAMGYQYPDNVKQIDKEWKRIIEHEPDISINEVFNNDSVGTYISKYFCKDFYKSKTAKNGRSLVSIFEDKELVRKIISNRLGISWYEECPGTDGTFNISPKMVFFQGPRSMRLTNQQSIYKPTVHKYLIKKYTKPGDRIYDYSAGWGARMLATASFGDREYVGVDPLTIPDLEKMRDYLKLKSVTLIQMGSEEYLENGEFDLIASSPPYYDQEVYSDDKTQANNNGEDYFYNEYWLKTLKNCHKMLKVGGYFGLNVANYPKMLDMAREEFGEEEDKVGLRTVRSHLNKRGKEDAQKYEYIYMFKSMG